jgi:hypothetical protein
MDILQDDVTDNEEPKGEDGTSPPPPPPTNRSELLKRIADGAGTQDHPFLAFFPSEEFDSIISSTPAEVASQIGAAVVAGIGPKYHLRVDDDGNLLSTEVGYARGMYDKMLTLLDDEVKDDDRVKGIMDDLNDVGYAKAISRIYAVAELVTKPITSLNYTHSVVSSAVAAAGVLDIQTKLNAALVDTQKVEQELAAARAEIQAKDAEAKVIEQKLAAKEVELKDETTRATKAQDALVDKQNQVSANAGEIAGLQATLQQKEALIQTYSSTGSLGAAKVAAHNKTAIKNVELAAENGILSATVGQLEKDKAALETQLSDEATKFTAASAKSAKEIKKLKDQLAKAVVVPVTNPEPTKYPAGTSMTSIRRMESNKAAKALSATLTATEEQKEDVSTLLGQLFSRIV